MTRSKQTRPVARKAQRKVESVPVTLVRGGAGLSVGAGISVYLNDTRIAGEKPWGGGTTVARWDVPVSDISAALAGRNDGAAPCPLHAPPCAEHGFQHGAEAEELRKGLELLIECADDGMIFDGTGPELRVVVAVAELLALLDRVDARDSLAFVERRGKRVVRKGAKS